jgi:hypothetical protein
MSISTFNQSINDDDEWSGVEITPLEAALVSVTEIHKLVSHSLVSLESIAALDVAVE